MRFALAFTLPPLLFITGLALATGFIAGVFDGQPALGAPLFSAGGEPVYSPFAVIGWTQVHAEQFPKPFAMARLIVLAGFTAAVLAFSLLIRTRGLPLSSGPPDLLARRFLGSSVHAATSP
jgi:hypothetical protein